MSPLVIKEAARILLRAEVAPKIIRELEGYFCVYKQWGIGWTRDIRGNLLYRSQEFKPESEFGQYYYIS